MFRMQQARVALLASWELNADATAHALGSERVQVLAQWRFSALAVAGARVGARASPVLHCPPHCAPSCRAPFGLPGCR